MTATTRSFRYSSGGFINPALVIDTKSDISVENNHSGRTRRNSSILPEFLRNLGTRGSKLSVSWTARSNVEVLPRSDNYRNENDINSKPSRPNLDDVHQPYSITSQKLEAESLREDEEIKFDPKSTKLGWVDGVYIRTVMNLFGVMLFLRMGWMAGEAGVILALVQIAIATLITTITTLSMIALCTNGDIGGGGIYAMISRAVGHEAGGVIGFMFTFTNAAFVGLNLLGTAESVSFIFNVFDIGICQNPSGINDQRIVGYILLVVIAAIPIISLEFESKTMFFFFLVLVVSLLDYFIGALIPPTVEQQAQGYVYWHKYVIVPNLFPRWDGVNFFGVFGVFFPSVTGIFTGASMSADLKDPATAIPLGTFLAIATTSSMYAIVIIFLGFTVTAYASGDPSGIGFNNQTCEAANGCPYGLINDYQTMTLTGALTQTGLLIDPLIYAGIFATTLSSALGCYTAAPRIFQAFCEDQLVPYITWFARGYGPANDPRHGYIPVFIVAAIFIAIGDVNTAGVWISNFYLQAFAMVNFSLFHASFVSSLSFRPSFIYYNSWISLLCGIFCIVLMFLFDYVSASVVCGMSIIIYLLMILVDPAKANWGPSTEEQCFNCARCITFRLDAQEDHVKHYRPMVLLICGNPKNRQSLVDMAHRMTKQYGLLFLTHITKGPVSYSLREKMVESQKLWLQSDKIPAFYKLVEANSLNEGIKSAIQSVGIGKFTPNIVMLGYKNNWENMNSNDLYDYFELIHSVLDYHFSLILFRVKEGHDFSSYFDNGFRKPPEMNKPASNNIYSISKVVDSQNQIYSNGINLDKSPSAYVNNSNLHFNFEALDNQGFNVYEIANRFKYTQKKGNVDVWWICDDGGLTLLIGYILKNDRLWRGCKLRVFTITTNSSDINEVQTNLTELLRKFRIPYSDVYALSYTDRPPMDETKNQFFSLISKWVVEDGGSPKFEYSTDITQSELFQLMDMTNKYLRLRELLNQHSKDSTLVIMTLPVPRKDQMSISLYMSWLEILTRDMPPVLLIRGNHTNVLTFYC